MSQIDNDGISGATGYLKTDVNGDEIIDGADISLADNNIINSVEKVIP